MVVSSSDVNQEETDVSHLWYCWAPGQQGDRLQSADAKALWPWQYATYWGDKRFCVSHLPPIKGKRACLVLVICLSAYTTGGFWEHLATIDTTSSKTRKCFGAGLGTEGSLQDAEHLLQGATTSVRTNNPWECSSLAFVCPKERWLMFPSECSSQQYCCRKPLQVLVCSPQQRAGGTNTAVWEKIVNQISEQLLHLGWFPYFVAHLGTAC